eukprot:Sspe_Gene.64296::Locus_37837_Transcript_1_1_Confidence_1.000_Length_1271::g.64296::m.64296
MWGVVKGYRCPQHLELFPVVSSDPPSTLDDFAQVSAAFEVLSKCDWSSYTAGLVDGTERVKLRLPATEHTDTVLAARNETLALHTVLAAGSSGAIRMSTCFPRKGVFQNATTGNDLVQREKTTRKVATMFAKASAALGRRSEALNNLVERALQLQKTGRLLVKPFAPSGQPLPLVQAVAVGGEERVAHRLQATSLLWSYLVRILPRLPDVSLVSLSTDSFAVGLLPWVSSPRWVLTGKAIATELKGGLREGHDVAFTVPFLPDGWVTGHLLGALADAIKNTRPHHPLLVADVETEIRKGIGYLKLLAQLEHLKECATSEGLAVKSVECVKYPALGKALLALPGKPPVATILVGSGEVVILDTTVVAPEVRIGPEALSQYIQLLKLRTERSSGK